MPWPRTRTSSSPSACAPINGAASSGRGLAYQPPETPGVLVSVDPPEHTFEARLVGKAFSKTYFDSFIPGIRAFVNEKIDAVFADGRCDLHETISEPLPLWVIFKMFGRATDPAEMQAFRVKGCSMASARCFGPAIRPRPQESHHPFSRRPSGRDQAASAAAGEADPDENLLTRFISSEIGGRRLTRREGEDSRLLQLPAHRFSATTDHPAQQPASIGRLSRPTSSPS